MLLFCYACLETAHSQVYYAWDSGIFYEFTLPDLLCGNGSCELEEIGSISYFDFTYCPNGLLYGMDGNEDIYQIDPVTLTTTLVYDGTGTIDLDDFGCSEDTVFYALGIIDGLLYEMNINTGSFTLLGDTGFEPYDGLTYFQGEYYFTAVDAIVHLNIQDPASSTVVVPVPEDYIFIGLDASPYCNILIAREILDDSLYAINLIDGSITSICAVSNTFAHLVTYAAYQTPMCETSLDLDCDDSSGAIEADYNAPHFTCQSGAVAIADEDTGIPINEVINQMEIELVGTLPDSPNERLQMTGSVPGINVSGSGSTMITLTNAGGASVADFRAALLYVRYTNFSFFPTAGLRAVEVQYSTIMGSNSNVATAFIQVDELPTMTVELGPDQEICFGENFTFDAGNPGAMFTWSTSASTQTITASNQGVYSVTVSDDINCPGKDTVELDVLPVVEVSLIGDEETCENIPAVLTLQTNSNVPLNIEVSSTTGSTLSFINLTGSQSFNVSQGTTTTYEIVSITSASDICLELNDSLQTVTVFPTYFAEMSAQLCGGDSIYLGYYWEYNAGVYNINLMSQHGCDSTILYTIESIPAELIMINGMTCDSGEVGIFTSTLPNPNGCDTIVQTIITLSPTDTTYVGASTCRIAEVQTDTLMLLNMNGCDSMVIIGLQYDPPDDTTSIQMTTCDSMLIGSVFQILIGADGCDSMVMIQTVFAMTDTLHIFTSSCDSSLVGVSQTWLTGIDGCDSLVITSTTLIPPDTTYLFTTSCDSSNLGTVMIAFTDMVGCDSLVITTTTFSQQDSTFVTGTTCDPMMTGIVYEYHVSQLGCDSIVELTVNLLPSDSVFVTSATCDPGQIGVFILDLQNQYGCDSIVTQTVTLLPSDETFVSGSTCISSEAGVFVSSLVNQYGCDSIVTETITLLPGDTTVVTLMTCDTSQVGVVYYAVTGTDGCDSITAEQTLAFPLSTLDVVSLQDFNGYDISCLGGSDGAVEALPVGEEPFTYLWSTGDTGQRVLGVEAGNYSVTVMDDNGCSTSDSIELSSASALSLAFEISEPVCFDQTLGSITVLTFGGVSPYTYSIDGNTFQTSAIFSGLTDGVYQITSLDANDCIASEIISIHVPLSVYVELGENLTLNLGDSTEIEAVVNLPFDSLASVVWTSVDTNKCPGCLTQIVAPVITTAYAVSVTSADGCVARDSLTVFVLADPDLYIPNIFSPNGDGINDLFSITMSAGVEEITSFEIFDRWGNLVFAKNKIEPDDPKLSWDGRFNGKIMNPGLFTYLLRMKFTDGSEVARYGDVTLVR